MSTSGMHRRPFEGRHLVQHHFSHVFLCVPSQFVAPYTLHVSRRYTQISRLSFFYPTMFKAFFVTCTDDVGAGLTGLHFTPRGLQLPSFSVVCYRARPRPLTVSAMLKANLFYTSFYKAVTSCLTNSSLRRGNSRSGCRGQPRLFFQSALSRPCLTGTCFTPRRSPQGSSRAACGVLPRAFLRCPSPGSAPPRTFLGTMPSCFTIQCFIPCEMFRACFYNSSTQSPDALFGIVSKPPTRFFFKHRLGVFPFPNFTTGVLKTPTRFLLTPT